MVMKYRKHLLCSTFVAGLATLGSGASAQDQGGSTSPTQPAQEILVTGSRIPQPNLTASSPVTVVNSQEIKLTGTTRVEDVLNQLPQVFASQGSTLSNGATGTATVNLRGLGPSRTLVLINGRRLGPGDPSTPYPDLNFVPATLIKRVDVLTGGASTVYGSDAVAGVVNFVMDTEFSGFKVDGQYSLYQHDNSIGGAMKTALDEAGYSYPRGNSANGGTVDATAVFGTGTGDGLGHIVGYVGYRKVNPVTQSSRDYSACALAADGDGISCGGSSTSFPGRFRVGSGAGHQDYTVDANGNFRPFNQGTDLYNYAPTNYYQRPDKRFTAGFFAHYDVSDAFKPYAEGMFMDDKTVAQIAPSGDFGNTFQINGDNPLLSAQERSIIVNPANQVIVDGVPVPNMYNLQISRRNVEGGPRQDNLQHTDYRIVVGAKGDIAKGLSYDVSAQYSTVKYSENYSNDVSISRLKKSLDVVSDPRTGRPVCRSALDGSDPACVPYNVFAPGGVTADALKYLETPGFKQGSTHETVVSANLIGQLGEYGIQSPWASTGVGINIGGEYRKESLSLKSDDVFSSGDLAGQGGPTQDLGGSFNVKEVFAEVRVPLVSDKPFFYDLSATGGYRYSHYSTAGSVSSYKGELSWAPIRSIRFRGGYNRAVRAPNAVDLFLAQSVNLDGSTDPCAGDLVNGTVNGHTLAQCARSGVTAQQFGHIDPSSANQYNGQFSGNLNLKPEKADTITLGAVIEPASIRGLSITVDYFHIKVKNQIGTYGADSILSACVNQNLLCNLVHRDSAGSLYNSTDGYVIDHNANAGTMLTSGIDFGAAYTHRFEGLGTLGLNFQGTWLDKLSLDTTGATKFDCVGYYGTICSATSAYGSPAPAWRHKLRLSWTLPDGISLSTAWRYYGSVKVQTTSDNPNLSGPVNGFDEKIKAQNYFDLAATAKVGEHYSVRMGVNNVLDKRPPIIAGDDLPGTTGNGNTFPQVYDALGRYLYVGATMQF
jgi:iron complex outermembrane recepter protein